MEQLERDMLLLWDRNFLSFKNVAQVLDRKAHLLARVRSNLILEPTKMLPDGSYLAKLYRTAQDRKKDTGGIEVRVIVYELCDPNGPSKEKEHRLITTLLDWEAHSALELVELYHQRWEELSIDELKTHQKERPTLRSKTPLGVVQEIEGLMLAHDCVRAVMAEAAQQRGLNPRRLSFTGTLKILWMRLQEAPKSAKALRG